MRAAASLALALLATGVCAAGAASDGAEYLELPAASFRSVFPPDGKLAPARVERFELRRLPVTNGEFLRFVTAQPPWRRGHVPAVFADGGYLAHWSAPDALGDARADQPVTNVSWFAAAAYCESEGARLPTWHEWEIAAAADETRADARDDPAWRDRILAWYSRPSGRALSPVGKSPRTVHGVQDLHALVWEWVEDFASLMVSSDNREQGDPDLLKFCGAGALSVADRDNYAVLMRTAMLSSLRAADTTRNLGFRCARTIEETSR